MKTFDFVCGGASAGASATKGEPIRLDEFTGCRFSFFPDPDGLPLELYEMPGT